MTKKHNTRGFFGVALDRPKTASNVGAVIRACSCYGAAFLTLANPRTLSLKASTNTTKGERHMPVFECEDALLHRPHGTEIVAVDLIDGAIDLPSFIHPSRAIYVFGAEDATLGARVLGRSQHIVMIPTRHCMNLAAAVNVVLYDRLSKQLVKEGR